MSKTFVFDIEHFSNYVVVYKESFQPVTPVWKDCPRDKTCSIDKFTDTENDNWWHDGIHYCFY